MQEYERAVIFRLGRLVKVRLCFSQIIYQNENEHSLNHPFPHHDHDDKHHIHHHHLQNYEHNKNCIILQGGARGPGIFFIVPCIDSYKKVSRGKLCGK